MTQGSAIDAARLARRIAIAEYTEHFQAALGESHGVASPLGAWMLLATLASAAEGDARTEVETLLGMDADRALEAVRELLEHPHPGFAAALAIWGEEGGGDEHLARWRRTLPGEIAYGPLPTREEADAWVRERTLGVLDRMPLADLQTASLLAASALVTRTPWRDPFMLAPAAELRAPEWTQGCTHCLSRMLSNRPVLFETNAAGVVAADFADGENGVLVVSVIAAPDVPSQRVIAAAVDVARARRGDAAEARRISLFDLPLEPGHAWELHEHEVIAPYQPLHSERATLLLPAWQADAGAIDLFADPRFGARALRGTLAALVGAPENEARLEMTQLAAARFDHEGFAAAAVTAVAAAKSAMPGSKRDPMKGFERHLTVRFSRPYACVAVAGEASTPNAAWKGLPVFSAWVARTTEPTTGSYASHTSQVSIEQGGPLATLRRWFGGRGAK